MKNEQRWEFRYAVVDAQGNRIEKVCYPRSKEKIAENRAACKRNGAEVVSVKKLYPINTYANQHNWMLIANICANRMYDMECGIVEYDDVEYAKLESMKERADRYFCLTLPTAWLPWEEWKDAKEMYENAIVHRQEACIAAGRPDLVTYC